MLTGGGGDRGGRGDHERRPAALARRPVATRLRRRPDAGPVRLRDRDRGAARRRARPRPLIDALEAKGYLVDDNGYGTGVAAGSSSEEGSGDDSDTATLSSLEVTKDGGLGAAVVAEFTDKALLNALLEISDGGDRSDQRRAAARAAFPMSQSVDFVWAACEWSTDGETAAEGLPTRDRRGLPTARRSA